MLKELVIKISNAIYWIYKWVVTPLSVIIVWAWVLTPFITIIAFFFFIGQLAQEEEDRQRNQTGESSLNTAWDKPILQVQTSSNVPASTIQEPQKIISQNNIIPEETPLVKASVDQAI